MGLSLFYAQRENRLVHGRTRSLPLRSICEAGGGEEKRGTEAEDEKIRGFEGGGGARPK